MLPAQSWLTDFMTLSAAKQTTESARSNLLYSLLFISGAATLTYAGICLALYRYQTKLLFRPLSTLIKTPADVELAYEDVWIPVATGTLHAWWIPNPECDRVFLFCHGNYGNLSYNTERIKFYHSLGFSVLAFDYRGYGQSLETPEQSTESHTNSEAAPTEATTYADAEAAWQYLTRTRKINPADITVCGHSIGGAVAIELATHHPDIANLIIESSFTTMKDAIDVKKTYRLFPVEQLLAHPFDSLSKVGTLTMPILFVHGAQDPDVPPDMSQRLYDAASQPKHIWIAPDATHNDISTIATTGYRKAAQNFLAAATAQARPVQPISPS